MSALSAQIETYRQSAPNAMREAALDESIDIGLRLYDALLTAVARHERRGLDPDIARMHHALAGHLADAFGVLLKDVKQAQAGGESVADAERLEDAWKELLPAAQFSYDRLHQERGLTKSAGEVRDGLRGQIPGRS